MISSKLKGSSQTKISHRKTLEVARKHLERIKKTLGVLKPEGEKSQHSLPSACSPRRCSLS